MLFLLLPFIFNPFRYLLTSMLPLYLMWWPLIMEKYGHEHFMFHVIIVIMFFLTKETTRQIMLKSIGFDPISLVAGLAMVTLLARNGESLFFKAVTPLISGLLYVVEPIFLIIETIIVMEMLRKFNKWIADLSNIRDEDSHDLSSWDPPLTRGSILARILVILITIACYSGAYVIVRDAKSLLGLDDTQIPVQFNHAIALLVTLQVISFFTTIYKEDGILSETACVALTASIPIMIASWSYYSLKEAKSSSRSNSEAPIGHGLDFTGSSGRRRHTDYVITSSSSSSSFDTNLGRDPLLASDAGGIPDFNLLFGDYVSLAYQTGLDNPGYLAWRSLELLAGLFKIIFDFMPKSKNNYLETEFWYILTGRLICVSLWSLFMSLSSSSSTSSSPSDGQSTRTTTMAGDSRMADDGWASRWKALGRFVCGSSGILFKLLLILTYAQMIIQVTENNKLDDNQLVDLAGASQASRLSSCCGGVLADHSPSAALGRQTDDHQDNDHGAGWFHCMWTSAKLCSAGGQAVANNKRLTFLGWLDHSIRWPLEWTMQVLRLAWSRLVWLVSLTYSWTGWYSLAHIWLARWRSPIIQRLSQSIFIQMYYIFSLVFLRADQHHQMDWTAL